MKYKSLIILPIVLIIGMLNLSQTVSLSKNFATFTVSELVDVPTAFASGEGDEEDEPTCASGGCNATSCSYSGEISVMGSGVTVSNSISCQDTWACCHLTAYCFSKSRC